MAEQNDIKKDLSDEPLEKKRKIDTPVIKDEKVVTDCVQKEGLKQTSDENGSTVRPKDEIKSNEQNGISQGDAIKDEQAVTDCAQEEGLMQISNENGSTVKPKDEIKTDEQRGISEQDAGITEYIGNHEGFSATIKQRYSDFIVNEIDSEGNIVHLKDMSLPADDEEKDKEVPEEEKPTSCEFISEEDWTKLKQLTKSEDKGCTVNIAAPDEKEHRTKVHQTIKKSFPVLETKTIEEDGNKFIQAFWKKGKGRGRDFYDDWPQSKRDYRYVKFVLYKENKDTMDAIGLMAKNLKLKESLFQYAGTKDRRAKTTQEITASRIHPKKLVSLNKVLWNFGVGDFRYVKEPLKLGQMSGNHFTMVLRNVHASPETVDKALESLKVNGFINYFGMQRFGTTTIPTHKVGKALLCGEWDKAVDLILMPRGDHPAKNDFQTIWAETKDAEKTLKATPCFCNIERNLLGGLVKKLTSFNAIEKIHRNTRTMYAHSYQAFVWNTMVSRRLRELGQTIVLGDLVMSVTEDNQDSSEVIEKPTPIIVTEENIKDFSLKDVVLPLPGCKIIYPENEVKSWYEKMLQEDNLDIKNLERRQKDYNMPGDYRHILGHTTNFSWQHKAYDDYTEPLTLSDFDILKRKATLKENDTGKLKAVVLEMSLQSSTYATMALREVLKIDTSARHQTTLNAT